jgi:hypothetical protein
VGVAFGVCRGRGVGVGVLRFSRSLPPACALLGAALMPAGWLAAGKVLPVIAQPTTDSSRIPAAAARAAARRHRLLRGWFILTNPALSCWGNGFVLPCLATTRSTSKSRHSQAPPLLQLRQRWPRLALARASPHRAGRLHNTGRPGYCAKPLLGDGRQGAYRG